MFANHERGGRAANIWRLISRGIRAALNVESLARVWTRGTKNPTHDKSMFPIAHYDTGRTPPTKTRRTNAITR